MIPADPLRPCAPPLLSRSERELTTRIRATNEKGDSLELEIAGEHPLTIYLDAQEIVTLMTLGAEPEALALGWLRNQRLVDDLARIASVQVDWSVGAAAVTTRNHSGATARLVGRTVTTGCGQGTMFDDVMASLDTLTVAAPSPVSRAQLFALLDAVKPHQTIYRSAGAVHGCALARPAGESCEIVSFVEDVGRHNAVDTIAGQMWLKGLTGAGMVFYTTGRLTSEMIIKTAQMGIPCVVSRSGLTQSGWEIANRLGITTIGRAVNRRFLVFTGDIQEDR